MTISILIYPLPGSLRRWLIWTFVPEIVEETEETQLIRDGNGALLRRHKQHDTTPETR